MDSKTRRESRGGAFSLKSRTYAQLELWMGSAEDGAQQRNESSSECGFHFCRSAL